MQTAEDHWHFQECTAHTRDQLYQLLLKDLKQMHVQMNLDMDLYYLLQAGLHRTKTNTPIPEATTSFPKLINQHAHQSCLGWEQLSYGQISISWAHHIDQKSNGHTNGTIFYSRIIRRIWRYALDLWAGCNLDLHQRNPDLDRPALTAQVRNLLHIAQQDPILQHMTNDTTESSILNRSTAQIHRWITTVTLHVHHHLAAARQRAILHTRDI